MIVDIKIYDSYNQFLKGTFFNKIDKNSTLLPLHKLVTFQILI